MFGYSQPFGIVHSSSSWTHKASLVPHHPLLSQLKILGELKSCCSTGNVASGVAAPGWDLDCGRNGVTRHQIQCFPHTKNPYFTSVLQRGLGRSCQVIKGCGHELGSSGKIPGVVWTGTQGFVAAGAIPHRVIIPQEFRGPCFFLGRKNKIKI